MADLLLEAATELEAVNFLLISIGEQKVNSLDNSGVPEVSVAQSILHQVSRQTQSISLLCNSEENYPLPLDIDNEIQVPNNVLSLDASDGTDVVLRGGRLYNRDEHSYKFEETLECDITFFLDFEDLPSVVRDYIIIRASRLFQSKVVGSETLHKFSQMDEMQARAMLMTEQVDNGDYNMLQNQDIIQMNRRS